MENTNQKNTGNIQIAPVSAAADLNHKREGYLTWDEYFMGVAMLSGMRSGSQFTGRSVYCQR